MPTHCRTVFLLSLAAALATGGCDNTYEASPEAARSDKPAVARQVEPVESELPQAAIKIEEHAGRTAPERPPLDLSMPPQPQAVPADSDGGNVQSDALLPDLFQQQEESDDDRAMHLKGRVLMQPEGDQTLDAVEGGQVIIEMKTR